MLLEKDEGDTSQLLITFGKVFAIFFLGFH